MKVTKELENKIDRLLSEKYSSELDKIDGQIDEIQNQHREDSIKGILKELETSPYFEEYIYQNMYGEVPMDEYVTRNIYKFVNKPMPIELNAQRMELKRDMKIEKEDLIIGISYEKNIDGIKSLFESKGLTF